MSDVQASKLPNGLSEAIAELYESCDELEKAARAIPNLVWDKRDKPNEFFMGTAAAIRVRVGILERALTCSAVNNAEDTDDDVTECEWSRPIVNADGSYYCIRQDEEHLKVCPDATIK